MKKALFIMIGIFYFFVLQFLFIGFLWGDYRFYYISIINFLFFMIFNIILYRVFVSKYTSGKSSLKVFFVFIKELIRKYVFVMSLFLLLFISIIKAFSSILDITMLWFFGFVFFVSIFVWKDVFRRRVSWGKSLFLPKDIIFVLSIVVCLNVFMMVNIDTILFSIKIFFSVLVGFLFFVLGIRVVRALGVYSVWKLVITRLYVLILVISLFFVLPQFYLNLSRNSLIKDNNQLVGFAFDSFLDNYKIIIGNMFSKNTSMSGNINSDINMFEYGTGEVIDVIINTGNSINIIDPIIQDENIEEDSYLTYLDVIKYLIDSRGIKFSQNKNLIFDHIKVEDENYKYFKTAKYLGLIGLKLKPYDLVKCDNFLVMKGLVDGWDINLNTGDIFEKYFNKAIELGETMGCERGNLVKESNI